MKFEGGRAAAQGRMVQGITSGDEEKLFSIIIDVIREPMFLLLVGAGLIDVLLGIFSMP
jgi:hypothetical protein